MSKSVKKLEIKKIQKTAFAKDTVDNNKKRNFLRS